MSLPLDYPLPTLVCPSFFRQRHEYNGVFSTTHLDVGIQSPSSVFVCVCIAGRLQAEPITKHCLCIAGWLQTEPGLLPVLHHGQLLLAPRGGTLPAHPPGGHILPQQVLPGLSDDRMG